MGIYMGILRANIQIIKGIIIANIKVDSMGKYKGN